MTSGYKFLLDTNVVIQLEDDQEVLPVAADMIRLCSKHSVSCFVAEPNRDDLDRDKNTTRKSIFTTKLPKFQSLKKIRFPNKSELAKLYGNISNENDLADCQLLHCLEIECADFIVSEDKQMKKRADKRGMAFRVLSIGEAFNWLTQTFEPKHVTLPHISDRKTYEISLSNPIFDSLREDYPGFDRWWRKCNAQHRDCWVVEAEDNLAGILVRKEETKEEAGTFFAGDKVLKICTFKMAQQYRGEKFGELLLKKCLWFAKANSFDVVYTTTFPRQEALISLFSTIGFTVTQKKDNGEIYLEKKLSVTETYTPTVDCSDQEVASSIRYLYPNYLSGAKIGKFCIPIKCEYHQKLFPELENFKALPLFGEIQPPIQYGADKSNAITDGRSPGNSIQKVYVTKSPTQQVRPGDLVYFYHSKYPSSHNSQKITSLGVVEALWNVRDMSELVRRTAKRTVFTNSELNNIFADAGKNLKVLDFLLLGHLRPRLSLDTLVDAGVFKSSAPQSIQRLSESQFNALNKYTKIDYQL